MKDKRNQKLVIDSKLLEHVASLAKITVNEGEVKKYVVQLEEIIEYFRQLDKIDTLNIIPTYQVIDNTTNVLREDVIEPSFSQKEALAQAKRTHKGYFLVEGVLNER